MPTVVDVTKILKILDNRYENPTIAPPTESPTCFSSQGCYPYGSTNPFSTRGRIPSCVPLSADSCAAACTNQGYPVIATGNGQVSSRSFLESLVAENIAYLNPHIRISGSGLFLWDIGRLCQPYRNQWRVLHHRLPRQCRGTLRWCGSICRIHEHLHRGH
jgi:hypothetical protein